MKHSPMTIIKKVPASLEYYLFRFLFVFCIILTATLNPVFILWLPIRIREVLPHIITFESCTLALLGIIFALALGLKDGAVYNTLIKQDIYFITSSYWRIFFACVSSVLTIIIAIVILAIDSWTLLWLKIAIQTIGLISCLYSILSTVHLLYYFTYLMITETKSTVKSSNKEAQ